MRSALSGAGHDGSNYSNRGTLWLPSSVREVHLSAPPVPCIARLLTTPSDPSRSAIIFKSRLTGSALKPCGLDREAKKDTSKRVDALVAARMRNAVRPFTLARRLLHSSKAHSWGHGLATTTTTPMVHSFTGQIVFHGLRENELGWVSSNPWRPSPPTRH